MKIASKTIDFLASLIIGDNEKSDYRTGSDLVDFFNSFGENDTYGQGFPSRYQFAKDKLNQFNGTDRIKDTIAALFLPINFINYPNNGEDVINEANKYFQYDDLKLVRQGNKNLLVNINSSHPDIQPEIPSNDLQRIWGKEIVRVFLSHKAEFKKNTASLKCALAKYGISAFVAHEDIEPTEEWQKEIECALFSMDALVALLTEDFHDSNWTDQEVGVAIGRKVPLIAVRLGSDPYGPMGKKQGLGGCSWEDIDHIAFNIFRLLHKNLSDKSRLLECAISVYAKSIAFAHSISNVDTILSMFEEMPNHLLPKLLDAFSQNDQNYNCLTSRKLLKTLLRKWTGKDWVVKENQLKQAEAKDWVEEIS